MSKIKGEPKLDFCDVLIIPQKTSLTSRKDVSLVKQFKFKYSNKIWSGVPIAASNMDSVGTFEMAKYLSTQGALTCIHKHYSFEQWEEFIMENQQIDLSRVAVSSGITNDDLLKLYSILDTFSQISVICMDVANGYQDKFAKVVQLVRLKYPNHIIIAGNVVTPDMTKQLILCGADIVKVGIGSGSVCTTRRLTGVGYPQLSAILECKEEADKHGAHIMSDGGCTCPGDCTKAFCGGADFVMLGGMLAGHKESEGSVIEKDGKQFLEFYGMSSNKAMNKHKGGRDTYKASEGKEVLIPYRGAVKNTLDDIYGGLRSACTYIGAPTVDYMSKYGYFITCRRQMNQVFS